MKKLLGFNLISVGFNGVLIRFQLVVDGILLRLQLIFYGFEFDFN